MVEPDRPLPRADLKVLELGHTVMGPTCGLIPADTGADVLKIEPPPSGDRTRGLTGFGGGFFAFLEASGLEDEEIERLREAGILHTD